MALVQIFTYDTWVLGRVLEQGTNESKVQYTWPGNGRQWVDWIRNEDIRSRVQINTSYDDRVSLPRSSTPENNTTYRTEKIHNFARSGTGDEWLLSNTETNKRVPVSSGSLQF